jgi:hypothetical protein
MLTTPVAVAAPTDVRGVDIRTFCTIAPEAIAQLSGGSPMGSGAGSHRATVGGQYRPAGQSKTATSLADQLRNWRI